MHARCPLTRTSDAELLCKIIVVVFGAQHEYFSYRAILVAIISQNYFVLVFTGIAQLSRDAFQISYRTLIARYIANWVSQRCSCAKLSTKRGYRSILGECESPLHWKVLNGVGVDGVGVISPFFTHFSPFSTHFPLFLRNFPLFLRFSLLLLKDKGKQQQFTAKMGISLRPRLHRPRAKLPDYKVSQDMGYCGDSIAISRNMGPLRLWLWPGPPF